MQKLLFTVFLFVLFFSSSGIAQKAKVELGPVFRTQGNTRLAYHIMSDQTGHYVLFYEEQKGLLAYSPIIIPNPPIVPILKKYDNQLKEVWSKEYYADKKKIKSRGFYKVKNSIIAIMEDESQKDVSDFYLVPINKEGELGEKQKLVTLNQTKKDGIPKVEVLFSRDSSKFCVLLQQDSDRKKSTFEYYLKMFDNDLKGLWTKKVSTNLAGSQIDILSDLVGDDGAFYFLAKEYESLNNKETKKSENDKGRVANYSIKVYRVSEGESTPKEFRMNLGGKFHKGASLSINESGEISCIGMFSNENKGNTDGIYFIKLDKNGQVIKSNLAQFTPQQVESLGKKNKENSKSGEKGLDKYFTFENQIPLDDGSFLLTAEENFKTTVTTGRTTTIVYHSYDIILMTISPDGNIIDVKVIPKRQVISGIKKFVSNYSVNIKNRGVYFFYNDDEDNLGKPLSAAAKEISSLKECIATMTFLDKNGKLTRKALFDKSDSKMLLVPDKFTKIGENKLFFTAEKPVFFGFGAEDRQFGIITFE